MTVAIRVHDVSPSGSAPPGHPPRITLWSAGFRPFYLQRSSTSRNPSGDLVIATEAM